MRSYSPPILQPHFNELTSTELSKPFTDIDGNALEALVARVTDAKENNLALSPEDCQLLLDALLTLTSMQNRLSDHDVTIHKLRKLLRIEKSSEKQTDVSKQSNGSVNKKTRKNTQNSGDDFTPLKPEIRHKRTRKYAYCRVLLSLTHFKLV